jgi:hypothetical protein
MRRTSIGVSATRIFEETFVAVLGYAITLWYDSATPLQKEYPTFLPSAPTLPMIRPHLLHDTATLDFDGKFGGPKLSGNLLIE